MNKAASVLFNLEIRLETEKFTGSSHTINVRQWQNCIEGENNWQRLSEFYKVALFFSHLDQGFFI